MRRQPEMRGQEMVASAKLPEHPAPRRAPPDGRVVRPFDPQVYDALPTILQVVNDAARRVAAPPLDAALAAVDRIAAAGCYTSQGRLVPVTPELAAQQRRLIEAAIEFRDTCVAAFTEPQT